MTFTETQVKNKEYRDGLVREAKQQAIIFPIAVTTVLAVVMMLVYLLVYTQQGHKAEVAQLRKMLDEARAEQMADVGKYWGAKKEATQ